MSRVLLQSMVETIPDDRLSANWADLDFVTFSQGKTLWDYQQKALRNAVKALWKYYENFVDYQKGEGEEANRERKHRLWEWYRDNNLWEDFSLDLSELNYRITSLLREYYESEGDRLSYKSFINRMAFWMATGSGKTLVIVKLIELLARLIQRGEIPPWDILFLTHRDDLIEQIRQHVDEFNRARGDFRIVLRELREYADVKREMPSLFREQEITVFYYRSDNLSDEQKEKIVDFRSYDNDGHWYVLLDEAHKGDREESKRQHLYAILSRNGFLFNFSATFTDPRDIATTVFNFNLSEYIRAGYGKHLLILQQEIRAFRDGEDYTGEEKQKVVLKALMMLAYLHKTYEAVRRNGDGLYHRPLMLVLVNSVNTEDADLQLFFRELERMAREGIDAGLWRTAKEELWQELGQKLPFMFEDEQREIREQDWEALVPGDLLQFVFNVGQAGQVEQARQSGQMGSLAYGEVEVLLRPSNRQEMVFKLKTAERPFALIKIGDISSWLKEKLTGYEVTERFEDESYFARLNEDDSDITILMGSRTFYEGWDSNRPNVICYINIGVGEDARKFILQSVGRGVRIEPIKNKRKRLLPLYNAGEIEKDLFDQLRDKMQPLETLYIFGTNRTALQTVIEDLEQERARTGEQQLLLFDVNPAIRKEAHPLLIPHYRPAEQPLAEHCQVAKFEIDQAEFEAMKEFVEATDDRVLLMLCDVSPKHIGPLRRSLTNPGRFYKFNERKYGAVLRLLHRVLNWWTIVPKEVDRLKELEEEIRHFQHITVTLEDACELQTKVKRVREYRDPSSEQKRLIEQLQRGEITPEQFHEFYNRTTQAVKEERFEYNGQRITIKHIAQHYYLPVVLSGDEKVDYIRHIIKTKSEVTFIRDLEAYLGQPNNEFAAFDWWFFSKLDENLDEVYIPYYDPEMNRIAKFKPDFIFWLKAKEANRYFILFVDPKGTEHTDWLRKLEGYRSVFIDSGGPKIFEYDNVQVSVHLLLRTEDMSRIPSEEYRQFWFDEVKQMVKNLLSSSSPSSPASTKASL